MKPTFTQRFLAVVLIGLGIFLPLAILLGALDGRPELRGTLTLPKRGPEAFVQLEDGGALGNLPGRPGRRVWSAQEQSILTRVQMSLALYCHPDRPVAVVWRDLQGESFWARTSFEGPGVLIVVDDGQSLDFVVNLLVHEWAHAMNGPLSFDDWCDGEGHNEAWGINYAHAYVAALYGASISWTHPL